MGLVRCYGNVLGKNTHPALPFENRSNATRSHVGSLPDFCCLHSSGTYVHRSGSSQSKEHAGTSRPVDENLTKSDSYGNATSRWHLSIIRVRVPIHQLGWFADLGTAARHFDPSAFFERGLNSLF